LAGCRKRLLREGVKVQNLTLILDITRVLATHVSKWGNMSEISNQSVSADNGLMYLRIWYTSG